LLKEAAKTQTAMDGIKWPGAAREENNIRLYGQKIIVGKQDSLISSGGEA